MMDKEIINRVAGSSLVTFDLETLYVPGDRVLFDLKDNLFQGLILKEKDFREFVKTHDWSEYGGKYVAVTCTADAIIPVWAFMLVAISLEPHASKVVMGDIQSLENQLFLEALNKVDWESFRDRKVVVKGCSKVDVPDSVYVEAAHRLRSVAASVMFGEACSTVPLYKRPKSA